MGNGSRPRPTVASVIRRVLYVSKTHLDVGFTDTAAAVRRRYLEDFFPRAMRVAAQLRAEGGPARLRWTTGSWILTEALDAADTSARRQLEAAIEAGDLCWHALPFTLHTEYAERSLVRHGLTLSAELDRRFGRRTRAAKATDVPGHTRGLVSLLADAGVDLLHVGVNPASTAPRVPQQFRWRDDAAEREVAPELAVMYQAGGYGDLQVVEGTDVAVMVDLTGDNLGPRAATELTDRFERLGEQFPGASVEAGTLDDVAEVMAGARDGLPVLTAEVGDSWVHGTGSDPAKTATFRAWCRQRRRWLEEGDADPGDPALAAASTTLLQVAEHTWGLDQKTHWPEEGCWGVAELAAVRHRPDTVAFEASWHEQRELLDRYVATLGTRGRPDLADAAEQLRHSLVPRRPGPVDTWTRRDPAEPARLGAWSLTFDPADGSVRTLLDPVGRERSGPAGLGRYAQRTYDAADLERWFSTYNAGTLPEDEWWARWDNTKPGLAESPARSAWWRPELVGLWSGDDATGPVLAARLGVRAGTDDPVATPGELWQVVRTTADGDGLELELCWFDLPAARWPTTTWWSFSPAVTDPDGWQMRKLGEWVSPLDVVADGGRRLHVADTLAHPDGFRLDLLDTGLVAPGDAEVLVWDERPIRLADGWHACLHANLWGTNFPMWTEGDARFRVQLRLT